MRLVPDMTAADTLAKVKAHLAKHRFGDIEVNMSGGYDPTQTDPDSRMVKAMLGTYRRLGFSPQVLPRSPGSWPGYRFTNPPLSPARRRVRSRSRNGRACPGRVLPGRVEQSAGAGSRWRGRFVSSNACMPCHDRVSLSVLWFQERRETPHPA